MKIGVVSCEYPPFRGGGIGTYSRNISRFLAEAGHEVHVVANAWADFMPEDTPPPPFVQEGNLTIHRIDALTSKYSTRPMFDGRSDRVGQICKEWESSLFWSVLVADKLAEICPKYGIEVIEFPETYAESYIATRRKYMGDQAVDVPYTITLHTPMEEVAEYNLIRKYDPWLQRRIMTENYAILRADRLSCPSKTLADMVCQRLQLDPDRHPCDVIHNPMDFDSLEDIPIPDPSQEERKSLLFVGRIEPRKGVKELIDAACIVMRQDSEVTVHLIGKDCPAGEVPGSMVEYMKNRIPSDLMPRFFFEGLRPREEVLRRYSTATACVFPAPWDNFPYTCCEAMAYHACVVASDHGGTAEMIEDGKSGLLFPAGEVGPLADRLLRVLRQPDLRRTLRTNAGPRIRDVCSPDKAVRVRIDHYQKAIDKHRQRGKILVPAEPLREKRLAAMVPNNESEEQIRHSVDSILRAARAAHLELDLAVVGTPSQAVMKRAPAGCRLDVADSDGFDSSTWHWFQHVEKTKPDFIFRLRPGETIAPNYFEITGQALHVEPRVAWATTWLESVDDRPQRPFVGFDFSLPLEMICYHSIPYAVIRYEAYREVGGYNFDLPTGWRDWDLYLALHEASWHGKVHATWGGRYLPWWGIDLASIDHPKAQELVLERIVRRNRKSFEEHGAWLWVSMISNQAARRAEREAKAREENPVAVANTEAPPARSIAGKGLVGSTVRRFRRLFKNH
ncbi:glycosyltransferase family 4 protein [bacterium]|nr:glycosyltransferase family 4 protein [bacterium]